MSDLFPASADPTPDQSFLSHLTLTDLMSDAVLSDLLRSIYSISGLRISLTTCQGDRILALHEYMTPFCIKANKDPVLHDACLHCTKVAGNRAAEQKSPFLYRCYAGLACAAIPVLVEDTYVATLVTSGFRVEDDYMAALEQVCPERASLVPEGMDLSAPLLYRQRILDIANLLSVAARYIAEAGLRNRMQAELHQKRLELMEQQQVQLNTEKLLSQAEFKALQSQINPHFLFNTLNAISQLAILEGSDQTAEAIFSLSALLRRSLQKNDSLPPLRDEMDNISEYLTIKKLLYRDRIRYVCDVDPACLSLRVPLFTLQPLVENALLHGLEPKKEGGTLTLSVHRQGDFIVIRIEDDGLGCSPAFVERVRTSPPDHARSDLTGIGMGNVMRRLSNHFGPAFHWEIDSAPSQGTRIALYLPIDPAEKEAIAHADERARDR